MNEMERNTPGFIPSHGGYRRLVSYQKAEVVYDLTFDFCGRFLSKGDRTIDQMAQAARSGKQNIVEGSWALGTIYSSEGLHEEQLGQEHVGRER